MLPYVLVFKQHLISAEFGQLQCDSGAGVDAFFHAIYTTKDQPSSTSLSKGTKPMTTINGRPFLMLLGPHCSHVTESVASVTSYWNIVQVITVAVCLLFISHHNWYDSRGQDRQSSSRFHRVTHFDIKPIDKNSFSSTTCNLPLTGYIKKNPENQFNNKLFPFFLKKKTTCLSTDRKKWKDRL